MLGGKPWLLAIAATGMGALPEAMRTLAQEQESYALDPGPVIESETPREPILTTGELQAEAQARMAARFSAVRRERSPSLTGYTLASLCRMHLIEPKLATREAILARLIVSESDAVAAVDLVAELESDAELTDHLLTALRSFLLVE